MKNLKMLIIFSLTICLLLLFAVGIIPTFAAGELTVKKITRITPPDYRASNIFYGERDWGAWNKDNTRLMINESTAYTHPVSKKTGRGLVWGFISDFKSWTDTADYEKKIKPLPYTINSLRTDPTAVWWSIFENNIVYAALNTGWIVKLNVDTNAITNVISFDPGGGVDIKNAKIYGWTKDNTLVMSFGYDDWKYGGYEINVQTPSKTFISSPPWSLCSAENQKWPDFWTHGHGGKSPSGNKFVDRCGGTGIDLCVTNLITCTKEYENKNNTIDNTHFSWKADEDWWISNSGGTGVTLSAPSLTDYDLHQGMYDAVTGAVTYKKLLTQKAPERWDDGSGRGIVYNWNAHFIATLRKDGKQILFTSTDGKYSYEDYKYKGKTPWGFEGFFLVDLAPVSGGVNDTPPNPPLIIE